MSENLTPMPIHGEIIPGEEPFHVYCGNEYMMLGPGRTIKALSTHLTKEFEDGSILICPSISQLRTWAKKYDWASRCAQYDLAIVEYKQSQAAVVFEHELAQTWGRVKLLIDLVETLQSDLQTRMWVPKTASKSAKPGSLSLNVPALQQLRGLLSDIALETGGRQKDRLPQEHGSISNEPAQAINLDGMTDQEIDDLSDLINKALQNH